MHQPVSKSCPLADDDHFERTVDRENAFCEELGHFCSCVVRKCLRLGIARKVIRGTIVVKSGNVPSRYISIYSNELLGGSMG